MTKKQYNRVLKACRAFHKRGGELIRGGWNATFDKMLGVWRPEDGANPCGCALAACLVIEKCKINSNSEETAAAKLLGTSPKSAARFVEGFDATGYSSEVELDQDMKSPWFAAGFKMGKQLEKEGLLCD